MILGELLHNKTLLVIFYFLNKNFIVINKYMVSFDIYNCPSVNFNIVYNFFYLKMCTLNQFTFLPLISSLMSGKFEIIIMQLIDIDLST